MDDLIREVELLREDPDDHKDYEDNYQAGWIDACNTFLELLHSRYLHSNPFNDKSSS